MKPILQINLDTADLDDALKIADKASASPDVKWIGVGKKLIKAGGLAAIKELKNRFPSKQLVVDIDALGRSRQLRSVIDAGADILLVPASSPEAAMRSFIDEFKRNGLRIMVDVTKAPAPLDSAKKADAMNINYLLVDHANLAKVSSSVITTVAVPVDADLRKVSDALDLGAQILVLDKSTSDEKGGEALLVDINRLIEEKTEKKAPEETAKVAADDEYLEKMTHRLDNIKKTLLSLEAQRKAEEENRQQMKKDMKEMEARFHGMMESEREKLEEEKKRIREQMGKINKGWLRLRNAEAKLDEKQKKLEKENKEKLSAMLKGFEAEMDKRLQQKAPEPEAYKDTSIEDELDEIRREWEEMEREWQRIDEDKKQIEVKKRDIESEWKRVESAKKTEPAKKPSSESKDVFIEKELIEVEQEWKDIEDVWGRIDDDKKEIIEKRREIDDEWTKIASLREEIDRQMKELEDMKSSDAANLSRLVSRVSEIKSKEAEQLGGIYEQRDELEKREREIEESERRIEAERNRIHEEIKKLEEEWYKIKEVKKTIREQKDAKKSTASAVGDLAKLKKEHEKPKTEEAAEEDEDAKNKETINRLIDLVDRRGEIKLRDAAKELDVKEYMLRRWGELLEKRKIVEIKAPLFGDVVLKKGDALRNPPKAD